MNDDYRMEIFETESINEEWMRVHVRLVDDMHNPEGRVRKPELYASIIVRKSVQDFTPYRNELRLRVERGETNFQNFVLTDVH